MKLYSIRVGNLEDLENKQYNIGVGISLGNKWFTPENIVELVKWSLQYTKEYVIIYVADSIHAINLEVRNQISIEKANSKADMMGTDILNRTKSELLKILTHEEMKKLKFVKWNELIDTSYNKKLEYLYQLYHSDSEFRKTILAIVRDIVSNEKRKFNEKDIARLGDYLIAEFPELINRVKMAGITCDAYVYPHDGEIANLTERIQKEEIFPEIKENIMDTEPKVFLEVR